MISFKEIFLRIILLTHHRFEESLEAASQERQNLLWSFAEPVETKSVNFFE